MFSLGLDIGTSKVALALTEVGTQRTVLTQSIEYPKGSSTANKIRGEQNAENLLSATVKLVRSALSDRSEVISAICVAGQMHGVVIFDESGVPLFPLVNWQDERCNTDPTFLPRLCAKTGHSMCSGFGCSTLAWLSEHGSLNASNSCGTIMDLLVARLCGATNAPVMDETNASSFGLYSHTSHNWDEAAVRAAGIPLAILPRVVPPGSVAGHLTPEAATALFGRSDAAGIPVYAATGDFQAALLATVYDPKRDIAINIGTGGQLATVVDAEACPPGTPLRAPGRSYEYRPFFGGKLAVTAASLSGGSAWKWLADLLHSWLSALGLGKSSEAGLDTLYSAMDTLGMEALNSSDGTSELLHVRPTFSGERHDPKLRGEISGITADNVSLGQLCVALAKGIVENLVEMMPPEVLCGKERIVASGNAIRRSKLLQAVVQRTFGLPLEICEHAEEAAVGASLIGLRNGGGKESQSVNK